MNETLRQGYFVLFILLVMFFGVAWLKISFGEAFIIIGLAGVVLKLADIQDTIKEVMFR